MSGDDTDTTTQTNAPSNPDVNPTLSKLLKGVQGTYDAGTAQGNPAALTQGWDSQLKAAGNTDYSNGVKSATSAFSDAASGLRYGDNDPYYKKLGDDTLRDVNAMFTTSGRFGSGSHVDTAVSALGDVNNANIAADREWQAQSASMLPGMFSAGQAPGSVMAGVGEQQRQAPWTNLSNASSILAGTASAGGTTGTTTSPATPWWQNVLGAGAIGAGIYGNVRR